MSAVIGLTGATGSGKSVVAQIMNEMGFYIIDSDKLARTIVEKGKPALEEIVDFFGADVLDADGNLERKKLGGIVFNDAEKLVKLNEITHKYIKDDIIRLIKENPHRAVVIDAPLLKEAGLDAICDCIIAVSAPDDVRAKRIMARDNISYEDALARINSQRSDREYRAEANFVINNSGEKSVYDASRELLDEIGRVYLK